MFATDKVVVIKSHSVRLLIVSGTSFSKCVFSDILKTSNGQIKVNQIGTTQSFPDRPAQIVAEVFVDLEDGPQSLNEAQLLAGVAFLEKEASRETCPRFEYLQKAQAEAQESKLEK